jgi:hypothetical protein
MTLKTEQMFILLYVTRKQDKRSPQGETLVVRKHSNQQKLP